MASASSLRLCHTGTTAASTLISKTSSPSHWPCVGYHFFGADGVGISSAVDPLFGMDTRHMFNKIPDGQDIADEAKF
jgi:hypothetical protein